MVAWSGVGGWRFRLGRAARCLLPRVAAAAAVALVATLLIAVPAAAVAAAGQPPGVQGERSVPGRPTPVKPLPPDPDGTVSVPAPSWPAAGSAVVDVPARDAARAAAQSRVRAGSLPVFVGPTAQPPAGSQSAAAADPARVSVEMLGRDVADRAGVQGVLVRLARADGLATPGRVSVAVDYTGFRQAFGGDFGQRLRLVQLPACAATTPGQPGCTDQTTTQSTNVFADAQVTAEVDAPATSEGAVFAVLAGPSGPSGDYAASPVSPSFEWQGGGSGGEFSWTYPIRVPPAMGGPTPDIALSYSSGSTDGRMAAKNNQSSWVGEGFNFWPGYIERRYVPCKEDGGTTADLCWKHDNAFLVFGGQSSILVPDAATPNVWRMRYDHTSWRIEKKYGGVIWDNDKEYWVLTDQLGTQYHFGLNRNLGGTEYTESNWAVPVYGNNAGEPCNAAPRWCMQSWRWNLDYVVDRHGNTMTYVYDAQLNWYRQAESFDSQYVRDGRLVRIDYGQRQGQENSAPAPFKVEFPQGWRCVTAPCEGVPSNWPDTPWDLGCDGAVRECNVLGPTFWTIYRLYVINTYVHTGGGNYKLVDNWQAVHSFPEIQTEEPRTSGLWLDKLDHSGKVGGSASLQAVDFNGVVMANRVDGVEGLPPYQKRRLKQVITESGAQIEIEYSLKQCNRNPGGLPTPDSNDKRCFPVWWKPYGQDYLDWFHKYVVTQVKQIDRTGGNPDMLTRYEYLDTPAWRWEDEDWFTPANLKTWSNYRGYSQVAIREGVDGAPQTYTKHRFMRGMHGDRLANGGTKTVTVPVDDPGVAPTQDLWFLQGFHLEEVTYSAPSGTILAGTRYGAQSWLTAQRNTPYFQAAYAVRTARTFDRTWLAGSTSWRRTETFTQFDAYTNPILHDEYGDTATTTDDTCTATEYARSTTAWMLQYPSRITLYGKPCTPTPASGDILSRTDTYYDNSTTLGAAPSRGLPTEVRELADQPTNRWVTTARTQYDAHGRPTKVTDALNRETSTAYTPATGGPLTRTVLTNPAMHTATTVLEPAWGVPTAVTDANSKTTNFAYDPLGRLIKVWLPGRSTGATANAEFAYQVRKDLPAVITTKRLIHNGTQVASYKIYDSLLRERQTQAPSPQGGRTVSDTLHDTRGLVAKNNGPYWNDQAPGMAIHGIADADVDTQHTFTYDGLERQTIDAFVSRGTMRWRTLSTYDGDRVNVEPPSAGTAITRIVDAHDRLVELRQYHAGTPTGAFDATKFTYTKPDELATVTDPTGANVWRYEYDLRGRKTKAVDPDRGTTILGYDDVDQLTSTTDARNQTLAYAYDNLGRKKAVHQGSLTGTKLSEWTYDTLAKGQLTSSTRFVSGHPYTTTVTGYDDGYRPLGTTVTLPTVEGDLAGSYTTSMTYNLAGQPATLTYPDAGGQAAETVTYAYDALGLPSTLTGADTYVSGTKFTKLGELAEVAFGPTGRRAWVSYAYNTSTRRLATITATRETAPAGEPTELMVSEYLYTNAGTINRIDDKAAGAIVQSQCFKHDHLQRVTEAWTATNQCATNPSSSVVGGPEPYWHTYTYDATGNRRTEVIHKPTGDTTRTYTYPNPGQAQPHTLRTVTSTGAATGTDSYGYDPTGNTTTRTVAGRSQTLAWDPEGHLSSVTEGTQQTGFIYDADGNRLLRKDPTGETLYLGSTELRHDTASDTVRATRYYTHLGKAVAIRTIGGGLSFPMPDHQGTGQLVIAAATLAYTRRRYTPFGQPRAATVPWPTERGFVDGTLDPTTGLTHLGAREYDPNVGRFISVDPLIDHTDPQQMHGYSYANNSPITYSDPDGLEPGSWCNTSSCAASSGQSEKHYPMNRPLKSGGSKSNNSRPARPQRREWENPKAGPRLSPGEEAARDEARRMRERYGSIARPNMVRFGLCIAGYGGSGCTEQFLEAPHEQAWCNMVGVTRCIQAHSIAREAIARRERLVKERRLAPGAQANAFQHAYWMALLRVNGFTEEEANLLGIAHEIDASNRRDKPAEPLGSSESRRDLINNQVGLRIGARALREGLQRGPYGIALLQQIENLVFQSMDRRRCAGTCLRY